MKLKNVSVTLTNTRTPKIIKVALNSEAEYPNEAVYLEPQEAEEMAKMLIALAK